MKAKKIVVLLKYFKGELNPFDGAALECAIECGFSDITVVAMAPPSVLESFRSLTRLGVKGIFISDSLYAGSDTQATSYILSEAVKRISPALVFCGRQSVDGDTAQVPPMLAERLGFDIKAKVIDVDEEAFTLRNGERAMPEDRTVFTFERIRTLRFPSIFSRLGEVEVWDNSVLRLPADKCGQKGSPTRVVRSYESSVGRRACEFTTAEELPRLIEEGLKKQRIAAVEEKIDKLDEVYYVGNIRTVAEGIGKRAVLCDVKGKSAQTVANELIADNAKAVLWEDSDELKIMASRVAVITGAGLCADCISFRVEGGQLVMTRPAQGGNITADISCGASMTFATVRTAKADCDDVMFSIGRGAIDKIEFIEKLGEKYGAEMCCSRIVADSGKMPYTAQVGLTGKAVSPKVYVAFGISGAVQHTSAIAGAGTIIAINSDPKARIFDYADYGIVADIETLKNKTRQ